MMYAYHSVVQTIKKFRERENVNDKAERKEKCR